MNEQQILATLAKIQADDRLNHYLRSRNITWPQYPDVNGKPPVHQAPICHQESRRPL